MRQPGEKIVGGAFDEKAIEMDRIQNAADARARLEQCQFGVRHELVNAMRCRETCDAAADDGDAGRGIRSVVAVDRQLKLNRKRVQCG